MRLPSGPLLIIFFSSAISRAATSVTSDEQDEAELENQLNSAIAEVASDQLKREVKHLSHASLHSDDYLRRRGFVAFLKSLSNADADPLSPPDSGTVGPKATTEGGAKPVMEAGSKATQESGAMPVMKAKPHRRHLRFIGGPAAAAAAKRKLDEELRHMREVHLRVQRFKHRPFHGAHMRHFSALGRKSAEAIRRLHHAHRRVLSRHRYGHGHPGLDRLRHLRRPKRASLALEAVKIAPGSLAGTGVAKKLPPKTNDVFPQSHPTVQRALNGMEGELNALRDQQKAATTQGKSVKDYAQRAHDGIKLGAAFRRTISAAKADIQVQAKIVGRIEAQQKRLKQEHDSIQTKLHKAMDPRIALRGVLVERKKHDLEKTNREVTHWDGLGAKQKVSALEMIRQRKAAIVELKEAQDAMKVAAKKEEVAKVAYEESKKRVSESVQVLKVYGTRLRAAKSVQVTEDEAVTQEEISLDRTQGILKVELERLDQALKSGEERLNARLVKERASAVKAEHKLEVAKTSYSAWELEQKKFADMAAKEVAQYESQQKTFEHNRENIMQTAADQAGARATAESDWDDSDWAWTGGIEGIEPEADFSAL